MKVVKPRRPGDFIAKDPDSIEPFGFDWTDWLSEIDPTEVITGSTYEISGPDAALTFANAEIVTGSQKTQAVFSGGTPSARYTVTNHIVTNGGYDDDRSFYILVRQG